MKSSLVNLHLDIAKRHAEESYAEILKVGAVLVRDGRVIQGGYNGMPTGFDNVCEEELTTLTEIAANDGFKLRTKDEVMHAEVNVIGYCAAKGIATEGCTMVITHVPCFRCAKVMLAARIKEIYYEQEFQQTDSLAFLRKAGIKVTKVEVSNAT